MLPLLLVRSWIRRHPDRKVRWFGLVGVIVAVNVVVYLFGLIGLAVASGFAFWVLRRSDPHATAADLEAIPPEKIEG